jgi:hypothetical protein
MDGHRALRDALASVIQKARFLHNARLMQLLERAQSELESSSGSGSAQGPDGTATTKDPSRAKLG